MTRRNAHNETSNTGKRQRIAINKTEAVEIYSNEVPVPQSLIQAVIARNLSNVKFLVENGSHVELADNCGWTSIHHAAYIGDLEILKLLLGSHSRTCVERLARVNWEEETPLITACKAKLINPDVIYYMLANGSDAQAVNIHGQSALFFACSNSGNFRVIKMLVDMRGKIMADPFKLSPIFNAIESGLEEDTFVYLIKRYERSAHNDNLLFRMSMQHSQYLPTIIHLFKPQWVVLLSLIGRNGSLDLFCICLRCMPDPVFFFQLSGYPYLFPHSMETLLQAVKSEDINFGMVQVILLLSKDFSTHLRVLLNRLYQDEINIQLDREVWDLPAKIRIFVSRYVFITPLRRPTLKEACRKAVIVGLFAKTKSIKGVRNGILSTNLPNFIKHYILQIFKPGF